MSSDDDSDSTNFGIGTYAHDARVLTIPAVSFVVFLGTGIAAFLIYTLLRQFRLQQRSTQSLWQDVFRFEFMQQPGPLNSWTPTVESSLLMEFDPSEFSFSESDSWSSELETAVPLSKSPRVSKVFDLGKTNLALRPTTRSAASGLLFDSWLSDDMTLPTRKSAQKVRGRPGRSAQSEPDSSRGAALLDSGPGARYIVVDGDNDSSSS
mmetsp:Transcript_19253/g.33075  ORF Transcript_19253/g.33075 Transcript_19253/m.33075 type:complete len:208 (+) Transcript_19253:90-713(+)